MKNQDSGDSIGGDEGNKFTAGMEKDRRSEKGRLRLALARCLVLDGGVNWTACLSVCVWALSGLCLVRRVWIQCLRGLRTGKRTGKVASVVSCVCEKSTSWSRL